MGTEGEAEAEEINQTPSNQSSSAGGVNIRTVMGVSSEMAPSLLVASSIAPRPTDEEHRASVPEHSTFVENTGEVQEHFQQSAIHQQIPYGYHHLQHYAHIPHHIHTGHLPLPGERVDVGMQLPQHLQPYGSFNLPHGQVSGGEIGIGQEEGSDGILSNEREDEAEETEGVEEHDDEEEQGDLGPVKLFVGQIPKQLAEEDIFPTFVEYGPIKDLMIIRDKITSQHRGCAFVTFWSSISASRAQEELHDKYHFPGARKAVQIKPASNNNEQQPVAEQENKLFVGMTSRNADEDTLRELFSPFGEIREIYIIRNADGSNKGCAFLKFVHKEAALAAIDNLHEKYQMEGATRPLIVKFADSRGQRRGRPGPQKMSGGHGQGQQLGQGRGGQGNPFYMQSGPPVPVYPGFQQQTPQVQPALGMQPQGTQFAQSHYSHPPHAGYMYQPPSYPHGPYGYHPGGPFGSVQGAQASSANLSEGYDNAPRASGHQQRKVQSFRQNQNQRQSSGSPKPGYRQQRQEISSTANPRPREGPPGANLFIYHLPHDLTDADLATAFNPFGNVISAKVYVDKFTGESKGFGFVSYDGILSAEQAIEHMNGFQIGSKRLKVQHKRINKPLGPPQINIEGDQAQVQSMLRGMPQSMPPQQYHSISPSHLDVDGLAGELEGLEVGYTAEHETGEE